MGRWTRIASTGAIPARSMPLMSAVAIAPEPMKPHCRIVPGRGKSLAPLFIPSILRYLGPEFRPAVCTIGPCGAIDKQQHSSAAAGQRARTTRIVYNECGIGDGGFEQRLARLT